VILALLWLLAEGRSYHGVSIAGLKDTTWTHVAVCGTVTLAKREPDGDGHIRVSDGAHFVVGEIVPYHPLPLPTVGQAVRVAGVSRYDKRHAWWEIHPIEAITVVASCRTGS
jgi:hypothetical protein